MNLKRLSRNQLLALAAKATRMAAALEPKDPMEQAIEDRLFVLEQEDRAEARLLEDLRVSNALHSGVSDLGEWEMRQGALDRDPNNKWVAVRVDGNTDWALRHKTPDDERIVLDWDPGIVFDDYDTRLAGLMGI